MSTNEFSIFPKPNELQSIYSFMKTAQIHKYIFLLLVLYLPFVTNAQNQKMRQFINACTDSVTNAPLPQQAAINYRLGLLYLDLSSDTARLYFNKALKQAKTQKQSDIEAWSIISLAEMFLGSNPDTSVVLAQKALDIAKEINHPALKARSIYVLGYYNYIKGNFPEALALNQELLTAYAELNDSASLAATYNSIGAIQKNLGEYDKAISNYVKAAEIYQQFNKVREAGRINVNIANVFIQYFKDYDKAIQKLDDALKIFRKQKLQFETAFTLVNLASAYREIHDYDKALELALEAESIFKGIQNPQGLAVAYNHIGGIYGQLQKYGKAQQYLSQSLIINEQIGNKREAVSTMASLAEMLVLKGDINSAIMYNQRVIEEAQQVGLEKLAVNVYKSLSANYEAIGNKAKALELFKEYAQLKDSLFTEQNSKQIREMETKYETDKKEKALLLQQKELELKDLEIKKQEADKKKQRVIIGFTLLGLLVVIVFSVVVYNQMRQKKKANKILQRQNIRIKQQNEEIAQANEEIGAQRDEIMRQKAFVETQRDEIVEKNQQITDSIQYAKRIQTAVLPPDYQISQAFPEHFIFYRPRNIVSGDFYFMTQIGHEAILVAADCTGHGVPGAFMSMLGLTFLSQITSDEKLTASEILEKLREHVIAALRQTGKQGEAKDGMDLALVKLNLDTLEGQYAGAYNPMYLVRNNELISYAGDKMPIGIYFRGQKEFTNHRVQFEKGDRFYLFSDGYVDQFGGPKNQKFMSKRFKELLLDIHQLPMAEQENILYRRITDWRGDFDQVDDMIVIGVEL